MKFKNIRSRREICISKANRKHVNFLAEAETCQCRCMLEWGAAECRGTWLGTFGRPPRKHMVTQCTLRKASLPPDRWNLTPGCTAWEWRWMAVPVPRSPRSWVETICTVMSGGPGPSVSWPKHTPPANCHSWGNYNVWRLPHPSVLSPQYFNLKEKPWPEELTRGEVGKGNDTKCFYVAFVSMLRCSMLLIVLNI